MVFEIRRKSHAEKGYIVINGPEIISRHRTKENALKKLRELKKLNK